MTDIPALEPRLKTEIGDSKSSVDPAIRSVCANHLTIRNFRNIPSMDIELPDEGVVIIGENGHGKTNLLEALYYLVIFRSFRGAKDRELVRFGTPGFFVAAQGKERVAAGYETQGRKKKVTLDREPVTRLVDVVGRFTAVAFSPSDRAIIAGGPSGRRQYLDVLLSLCEPSYLSALSRFRTALKQRNAGLRRGRYDEARVFNRPFAEGAIAIGQARQAWASQWGKRFGDLCVTLGESVRPKMRYDCHGWTPTNGVDAILETLESHQERDVHRAMTTVGPQRDDIVIMLDDHTLRTYGSAGQQRTAAIALRLIEAETLATVTKRIPIGLYDDVFAELDARRQRNLLELIRETLPGQAIVTAPRDSEVPKELFDRPRWQMERGNLAQG